MSQANVEFLRNLMEGAGSLDKQALLDALPELIPQIADPEIEWFEDPTRADGAVYRGHEGVRESWTRWLEQWGEYEAEIEELVDCGDDVFVVARERGRGAASGATVSARLYVIVTVRDLKVTRWREFYDEASARDAAGLS